MSPVFPSAWAVVHRRCMKFGDRRSGFGVLRFDIPATIVTTLGVRFAIPVVLFAILDARFAIPGGNSSILAVLFAILTVNCTTPAANCDEQTLQVEDKRAFRAVDSGSREAGGVGVSGVRVSGFGVWGSGFGGRVAVGGSILAINLKKTLRNPLEIAGSGRQIL